MNYKYYILPVARAEFQLARERYRETNVRGLSVRFAQSVKDCIRRIQDHPFAFAIRYKDVRMAHTAQFPYALHFYLEGNMVIITAILYQGRNPNIAQSRVE